MCVPGQETISIHAEWLQISDVRQKQKQNNKNNNNNKKEQPTLFKLKFRVACGS